MYVSLRSLPFSAFLVCAEFSIRSRRLEMLEAPNHNQIRHDALQLITGLGYTLKEAIRPPVSLIQFHSQFGIRPHLGPRSRLF